MSAAGTSADRFTDESEEALIPDAYLSTGPVAMPWPRSDSRSAVAIELATANDADLALAATGDTRAFTAIYDRCSDRLFD